MVVGNLIAPVIWIIDFNHHLLAQLCVHIKGKGTRKLLEILIKNWYFLYAFWNFYPYKIKHSFLYLVYSVSDFAVLISTQCSGSKNSDSEQRDNSID